MTILPHAIRHVVSVAILLLLVALFDSGSRVSAAEASPVPATGAVHEELKILDDWMSKFLAEHTIPGGSLAVVRDGKLVYARGFGYADREAKTLVEPDSLFRIASVSKPITAVAICPTRRAQASWHTTTKCSTSSNSSHISKTMRSSMSAGGMSRSLTACPIVAAGIAPCRMIRCSRPLRMQKSLGVDFPITPPAHHPLPTWLPARFRSWRALRVFELRLFDTRPRDRETGGPPL